MVEGTGERWNLSSLLDVRLLAGLGVGVSSFTMALTSVLDGNRSEDSQKASMG